MLLLFTSTFWCSVDAQIKAAVNAGIHHRLDESAADVRQSSIVVTCCSSQKTNISLGSQAAPLSSFLCCNRTMCRRWTWTRSGPPNAAPWSHSSLMEVRASEAHHVTPSFTCWCTETFTVSVCHDSPVEHQRDAIAG